MGRIRVRNAAASTALGLGSISGRRLLSSTSVLALVLSAGLALPGLAQAADWTGAASTDWFTAGNWSPGAVPTAGDNAIIDATTPNPTVVNAANAAAQFVIVGNVGTGALTITGGGTVSTVLGWVGESGGSNGTVTVAGAGSTWTNSFDLLLGKSGTGTVNISNGGVVSSVTTSIGYYAASTGTVTVDGAGSTLTNSGDLNVGIFGAGTLAVSNGGNVNNAAGYVGAGGGGVGAASVDGVGSTWTNTSTLTVGANGTGTLTVSNGGMVHDTDGYLGFLGTGTATVTGVGSIWANTGNLSVGNVGTGTLNILSGALVTSVGGVMGNLAGSTGTVTVNGIGSNWANSSDLWVGNHGIGSLTISNGGVVSNDGGVVGNLAGSTGVATVDGVGSIWSNASGLLIGNAGAGTLTITNGGTVSSMAGYLGYAAGSNGTATIDGAGSTWTSSGALLVIGNVGAGTLNITNGGTVSSMAGYLGYAAGSNGTATIDGAGSTWTSSGALQVGVNGTGTLTISNGGKVSNTMGYLGANVGSLGTATISGAGATWINSSDLSIGSGGTGTLTIANSGVVSVGGIVTIASLAGSTGNLNIGAAPGSAAAAPGTLTAATVQFGAGTGAINFNHTSSSYLFSPDITGTGAVNQLSGTTILTGNNTYNGPTTVDGGTLLVNGSIANSTTIVNTGGTLGGIGTVGDTTISGGTLAPGNPNSIGTLTIAGNLVLTTAATYMVQVSGASASNTVVVGAAQLAGTLAVNLTGRVTTTTTYVILSSANTTGTFDTISISNPAYARNARVSLAANGDELLTLDAGLLSPTLPGFANINQKNVAAGIDNALLAGGSMTTGFNKLFGATGQNLLNGLTQASGEVATGAQQGTFSAMGQFLNTMLDPFLGNRNDPSEPAGGASRYADDGAATRTNAGRDAYAAIDKARGNSFTQRWNVWAAGYGGSQTTDGNTVVGSNTATSRIAGVAAGADYLISPNTLVGFALGGGGTSFGVANGLGSGSSDLFQAGVYARHTMGNAYVAGALAYGWQDVTTDRTVTIAGVDHLRAKFNANALSGRLEGGYRYVTPWMGITPYAAAQFTSFFLPGYGEQAVSGANTFALNYAGRDVTATRSELGLRTDRSYALETAILTLRSRAAWAHDYNPDRAISATFQTLPGASFVVNGAASAHDAALLTGAAELKWLNGFSLSGTFEGEFSNVTRSYTGKGIARYQW
ncbi:autotransporter domain-containing protein [Bradyrhizobium sp. CCGUVB1N3]|uniref:autotransporter domain-containing protein n=1 Tax=Bradyrhizobium sp. CCGUVB1N3 TaxID=2949629 RepID=UPI0020B19B1D|nr:autotransporter domain-containing protein [Bradyrhizobium sp. CCGUVB1N3]MCP3473905.1 autotransporter domain-containing protein [Bradyrhizobium sp. CCGUVB1N3]